MVPNNINQPTYQDHRQRGEVRWRKGNLNYAETFLHSTQQVRKFKEAKIFHFTISLNSYLILNRTGKTFGACLKKNNCMIFYFSEHVSCTTQVHTYDSKLAYCDIYCVSGLSRVGLRAVQKHNRAGEHQEKEQYSQHDVASEDKVGMDQLFTDTFPHPINVLQRPVLLQKFIWVAFSLAGWKIRYN